MDSPVLTSDTAVSSFATKFSSQASSCTSTWYSRVAHCLALLPVGNGSRTLWRGLHYN